MKIAIVPEIINQWIKAMPLNKCPVIRKNFDAKDNLSDDRSGNCISYQ